MSYPNTKLNPTAPSFPVMEAPTPPRDTTLPIPPPVEDPQNQKNHINELFNSTPLPDWMLVEENEKIRVAALSLPKMATRDEWIGRLRQFADSLAPGHNVKAKTDSDVQHPGKVAWTPLAIRQMPPPLQPDLTTHGVTFSRDFIQNELRGTDWSPGFHFILPQDRREDCKVTAYWILDSDLDPYLPKEPGQHGAKLTPFFNSTSSEPGMAPTEDDYMNAPVFIGQSQLTSYRYFGHYSQTRYSDKLDYERMVDGTVPPFVLIVWAKYLTQDGLPSWVTEALREHIWPKPVYYGPYPLSSPSGSSGSNDEQYPATNKSKDHDRRVKNAMARYAERLQDWDHDTKVRLRFVKEADIHRLFHAADSDEEVGLRLWFEYLECTSYENSFYEKLVELKYNDHFQRGHDEKISALLKRGWHYQLAEEISGSGHTRMVEKLCPPTFKKSAARRDSVMGREPGSLPLRNGESEHNSEAVSDETRRASGSKEKPELAPQAKASTSTSLPPHLRGRAGKQESRSPERAATETSDTEITHPKPFPSGDLEAAKALQASFTKARPKRDNSGFGLPSQHATSSQQPPRLDRNDPMNQGWARAGRNTKVVEIDSYKNVIW